MTTTTGSGYRAALTVGEFRALLGSGLVSFLGDSAAYLAVTVLVYQRTGSPLLSALTFVVAFLPYLVGGTLLSGLVDRLPPRRLLIGADLLGASLVAALALPGVPLVAVFAVLVVLGCAAPVRSGQAGALLAEVLPGDAYVAGRSLMRLSSQLAQVVGAAAGGALIAPFGPRGALLADSVSFLGSAALVRVGVRRRAAAQRSGAASSLLRDSVSGVRAVWRHAALRRLLLLGWAVPFVAVAPEALAAPAVRDGGWPTAAVGWWLAAIPAGVVVGDVVAVVALRPGLRRRLVLPLAAAGPAALVCFATRPPLVACLVLLAASGVASAYALGLDQMVRDTSPPELLARTLTVSNTGLMVGQGLGLRRGWCGRGGARAARRHRRRRRPGTRLRRRARGTRPLTARGCAPRRGRCRVSAA